MNTLSRNEIKGCMIMHLLVFKPNAKFVSTSECLCDCISCLQLNLENCEHLNDIKTVFLRLDPDLKSDESKVVMFDNYYEEVFSSMVIIEVNLVVAVLSCHTSERSYLTNVKEKCIADDMIKDLFSHVILEVEQYFRGNYLKNTVSKHISKGKFDCLQGDVCITPGEVFEIFSVRR